MQCNYLCAIGILFCIGGAAMADVPSAAEEETEILKITVGEPTQLSRLVVQNTACLMVSRTGVVAAFYPNLLDNGPKYYRVSTDGGHTWSPEMKGPPQLSGGQDSGTLRDGGIIMATNDLQPSAAGKEGWYDVMFVRFADDMLSWESELVQIYLPDAGPPSLDVKHPGLSKGKMVQLPSGDMLAPMYGGFKGDSENIHRAILVRSTDQGRTWEFYASIAYEPVDPHPELPGQYCGAGEPSITLLPNGKMVAMLRTQYSHLPSEYKPHGGVLVRRSGSHMDETGRYSAAPHEHLANAGGAGQRRGSHPVRSAGVSYRLQHGRRAYMARPRQLFPSARAFYYGSVRYDQSRPQRVGRYRKRQGRCEGVAALC